MLLGNNTLGGESVFGYSQNLIFTSELMDFLVFEKFNLSSYETSQDKTGYVVENHNLFDVLKNELTSFQKTTRDGGIVTNTRFSSNPITLDIGIVAKDTNDLIKKIQDLKRNIFKKNGILQVNYGGLKKRAVINIEDIKLPNNFYSERLLITSRKGAVTIQATRLEHWEKIDQTHFVYPNTTGDLNLSLYVEGDSGVYPKFIFNIISGASNISKIEIDINGYKVSYSGDFSTSNRIEFDFKNEKITKNVDEVFGTGLFSKFDIGVNDVSINFTSSGEFIIEPQIVYNEIIL